MDAFQTHTLYHQQSQADIICLQEYWFDSPAFRNLYEAKDSEVGLATR